MARRKSKPSYRVAALTRDLEAKGPEPAYLVLGGDAGLRRRARSALEALVPEDSRSMDLEILDGAEAETDWSTVAAAARTLPWMSERRVVLVDRADQLGGDPSDVLLYLDSPSKRLVLALLAPKVDRRTQPWKTLSKTIRTVSCDPPREDEIRREAGALLKARGLRPEAGLVRRVAELVGPDVARLESEVEKLALAADEGGTLHPSDVDRLLGRSREREVWDFTDSLAQRDRRKALRVLAEMLEDGTSEHYLVAMAAWNTRRLLTGFDLLAEGRSPDEVAKEVKAWGPGRETYFRGLKAWDPTRLRKTLRRLAELDRTLKSSALPARIHLERFVLATTA